jgi:protein-S-isoprenylcysteine O-methyltransferase Ste14
MQINMPSRRSEVLVTEFLRDALAVSALGVPELEARARATGLLGEGQSITHTKAFKRAKKFLRIRSLRAGFGARSQWRWQFVALLGSFLFVLLVPFLSRNESSPTLEILSILLMLSGSILSIVVLLYLGRSFSILPEVRRLVVTGPYRFVRHPLYATEMICMLGLVIQFTLWPAVIVFLIQLLIQLERMRIEEQLLNRTFPEYERYASNTARLIPGLC